MPNQMIALQSRNPQLPDPMRQTAQYANMMNMARQQEAAQRQAALAQQTMDINKAEEGRRVALQPSALAKAEGDAGVAKIKYFMDFVKASANDIANSSTPEQAIARGERLKQQFTDPALQARIDETIGELVSDPSKFEENRKRILIRTLDTKDQFAESHSDIFDADGNLLNKVTSPIGAFSTRITPGVVTDLPSTATQTPPPRATPTMPPASAMERGPSAVSGAPMTFGPDETRPLNAPQQEDLRRIQSETGMTDTPASFTRGGMGGAGAVQMTPDVMSRIVDSAFQTGVMAQVDFDQLLATQPPENRQAFTDAFRRANVTLQADAPSLADSGMGQQQYDGQTPQSIYAKLPAQQMPISNADLGSQPMTRQTLAQYQVGQQVKGKNPSVSPYPASAQVPLSRVAGEAEARRETPAQIQARKTAELQAAEQFEEANKATRLARKREEVFAGERAKKDAAFLDTYSDATTKSRTTLDVIDQMIGDARLEKGRLVVPKGGRRPHPGFEGVVGMGVPGVRLFPGTAAAGFDALFEQAEGGAFLQAYESLRGTGQITEIEGTKATSALTRMKRSQSEAEFVKAAREFADVLRAGIARADKRYTKLTGEAPAVAATQRKTPTKGSDGWGKAKVVGN